jgi:predicted nucleic-acid-binding protein
MVGAPPSAQVADIVVAETVYVLESFYEAPRGQVATAMRSLLDFDSIVCVHAVLYLSALEARVL